MLAHHFREPGPRARAMCIAVAGSSLGGLLHPIMLNALFYGVSSGGDAGVIIQSQSEVKTNFARGVRASAGLVAGMQLIAVLLMRTRYPQREQTDQDAKTTRGRLQEVKRLFELVKRFSEDWPYVCFCLGRVSLIRSNVVADGLS